MTFMTGRHVLRTITIAAVASVALVGAGGGQTIGQNEDLARRHYELGLGFMETQKYAEALKDFQTVVDSYPTSAVAGDALVEMARYHLEVARDPAAAQAATDIILKKYASTEAAPVAYVLSGRIAGEKGRSPAEVDAALASFERVPALFPASEAVPSSIYYAGEALRLVRRPEEALERYRQVPLKYPTSPWAARALLGVAMCLTQIGSAGSAIEGLQRVRTVFPGTPEAATALNWNTILYRLYIRPPAQPPYTFSGKMVGGATAKFRDVSAVAVDGRDNVLVAQKTVVSVFDSKGSLVRSIPSNEPSALLFSPRGVPVFVSRNSLFPESAQAISLAAPQDGQTKAIEEIPAAAATSKGDWLISDRKSKAILAFSAGGKYLKPFATAIAAERLALNGLGDVAALDRENKVVTLFDLSGKVVGKINTRGTGYALQDPVDVAFDPLGHLYVLDRERASVFVFGPQGKFVATFSIPEKSPGAFQRAVAFGLDSAARLYIFDDRAQHVQVYQ